MLLYLKILFPFILLLFSSSDDQNFYKSFMRNGFIRLEQAKYQEAYNDFDAAYELEEITEDQKYEALFHRNLSDSCLIYKKFADNYYESGNYRMAAMFYLKVFTFNDKDIISKRKYSICSKKIKYTDGQKAVSMAYVKKAVFSMGNKNGNSSENITHTVQLNSFFVDKYEVTNQQYADFLNEIRISPKNAKAYIDLDDFDCKIYYKDNFYFVKTGLNNFPVVEVSWFGAKAFANHYGKRLPTEAEWEYIAISSQKQKRISGYKSVGSGKANDLGIFNLLDNVREWCADYYWENFYRHSPVNNPKPINDCDLRVVRGAAFNTPKTSYYSRDFESPYETAGNLGFRCVKDIK